MIIRETKLAGAFTAELEKREDDRGFFARAWCSREFDAHGLVPHVVQVNLSLSRMRGTLRGMHYQVAPSEETKFIRCTRGALYDVIVDLRPDSSTYLQWIGLELSADNYKMLYVPRGFAHGFQTLCDDTEANYLVSEFYAPQHERGMRYNDAAIGIDWPLPISVISPKDASWPDYVPHPSSEPTSHSDRTPIAS
ncbi:MAG: dTDP-4-dehydrorhamnose 3,5-epimerase [Pirellulaceae bacterium]